VSMHSAADFDYASTRRFTSAADRGGAPEMRTNIVFTLTGPDRVGIVEEVTRVLLDLGGNVETSRMARLGGEFAILMLLSLPSERLGKIDMAMEHLTGQGYKTTYTQPGQASDAYAGWAPYRVQVHGADHEGIVHDIAAGLSVRGITIESMETGTYPAPVSGASLFDMIALVLVPPGLDDAEWISALDQAGQRANVDIEVTRQ
jgi:glycine cleavage system transcriptional repressor